MKILKITIGILVVVTILAVIFIYGMLRATLPEISGEIITDKVYSHVTVMRDIYGVPHIFAENEHDVFFTLGYCQAQDRLWQMDIMRRAAYGRLSEVFGKDTIEDDRFLRTIFAPKSASEYWEDVPPEMKPVVSAYTEGVNFYLENTRDKLPIEFLLLGYKMEPWKAEDTAAMNMIMAYALNCSMDIEILRAKMAKDISEAKLNEVFGYYPKDSGYIYPDFVFCPELFDKTLFSHVSNLAGLLPAYHLMASNSWAISGKKTASGRPILADDSHMALEIPNSYYQVHMCTPEFTVHGGSIPGTPLVVEGHTDFFAWGLPTASEDPSDFYVEKIRPENPHQYLYEGKWRDMKIKKEIIKVKGADPVEIEIWMTHHGPVISDVADLSIPSRQNEAVALCWTMYDKGGSEAFYHIMKAKNWREFGKAARMMACPGSTFVYADADGNIAMWAGMVIPIRKGFDGMRPLPGWDEKYDWKGYVPPEELPYSVNPESGFVAAANNRIAGKNYPYYISSFWAVSDRFLRIVEMIEEGENKIDFEYMVKMQTDVTSLTARRILPSMIQALDKASLSPYYAGALEELRNWDYVATAESSPASIFYICFQNLLRLIYFDEMGQERFNTFIHYYYVAINSIYGIIGRGKSLWVDNITTPEVETLDDLYQKAFKESVDYLRGKYGEDIHSWQWGKIKPIIFYHPIGKEVGILGKFLNDGPYPIGGTHTTVSAAGYPMDGEMVVNHGPALRMIIDYSNPSNWVFIEPPGNSGNFMSRHYKDQTGKWLIGEYNPILLNRKTVEKNAKGTIVFKPKR